MEQDQLLLAAARNGEIDAVDELYRRHLPVARSVARGLCRPDDVDDAVSEAFTRVLDQIRQGRGPQVSFRAYLITAVRSTTADLARKNARLVWTDELEEVAARLDAPAPDASRPDSAVRQESPLLAEAVRDLPARWQLVMWWSTVELLPPAEVGRRLGISANAASALAFRAREGLREAYLRRHLPASTEPSCVASWTEYVAAARSRSAGDLPAQVTAHLDSCDPCHRVSEELRDLGLELAALG